MAYRTIQQALLLVFSGMVWCSGVQAQPVQMLKPGLWQTTTQVWIDGKDVMATMRAATDQILNKARAEMTPEQRADLDNNMPADDMETECITAEDAAMNPQDSLRQALQSMHQAASWACSFSNERTSTAGYSFDYRCSTPAHARAEGKARLEIDASKRSYRADINGDSHVVNDDTGAPLHPRMVKARSLTTGQWRAAQCE